MSIHTMVRRCFGLGRKPLLGLLVVGACASNLLAVENVATHKQVRSIVPTHDGNALALNTFCVGPDNHLYLCCSAGVGSAATDIKGTIMVYTGEGELVRTIPLSFAPQAINFATTGTMFVAGSGKVARIGKDGEIEIVKDAPNIGNSEEMMAQLKEAAEEQKKLVTASYTQQLDQIKDQIAKLETEAEKADPADEKGAKRRDRRLKMLNQQQEQWQGIVKSIDESFALQSGDAALAQMMRSSGIAVSQKDVFVSLPKAAGFGYAIYRMNHDLEDATIVVKSVGGCCGQLDIQSDGEHLLIAENTSFKVGIYDRDGEQLDSWGKRGRTEPDGFGSCCNPMNVRCCANGEILTAESSIGDIKRFSKEGDYLGLVGRASVGGGCKHVAIGWDSERNWHYMMNQDKSSVAVLVPKDQAPAETEDERLSRLAMESMGIKLIGTWEMVQGSDAKPANIAGATSMDDYLAQRYGHIEFAGDGSMIGRPLTAAVKNSQRDESTQESSSSGGVIGFLVSALGIGGEASLDDGQSETSVVQAAQMFSTPKSTWKALPMRGDAFDFVIVEDDVQSYGASVHWVSDDAIKLTWFYGSPEQPMPGEMHYKRISRDACGQKCDAAACEETETSK